MATVKEILGHQEIDMTLRYAYLAPVHKMEAMEILGSKMDTFWSPEDSIEAAKNRDSENILENKGLFENGAVPKWLRERSAKPKNNRGEIAASTINVFATIRQ